MSYEYLKGMSGADVYQGATTSIGRPPAEETPPPATNSGGAQRTSGAAAGSTGIGKKRAASSVAAASSGAQRTAGVVYGAKGIGAKSTSTGSSTVEPPVPAGSVRTEPAERVQLKEWCRRVFGQNSAFYKEKLRIDPNFTYLQAASLAGYRNAVAVVIDMLRGYRDASATVSEISGFKAWWLKCHPVTFHLFSMQQQAQDASWVPLAQFTAYRTKYKTTNTCPPRAERTSLFEYKTVTTASQLSAQDRTRKQNEVVEKAADAVVVADAAVEEANRLKQEAADARAQIDGLNSSIRSMQETIDQLNRQIASSPSSDAVARLQTQITDLMKQLAAAQARVPVVQVQAQETAAVAEQATQQADELVAEADAIFAETQPWYLRYKWYLLGGAALLAGGAYWFMNKHPKAVPAIIKNWLPEPTSPRRPSGLRGNPEEFDSGRPPRNAPKMIWNLFLNMARSARETGGESPSASIYWSHDGKEWSIGDNFDRYGHFIVRSTGPGKYRMTYRGAWGDLPINPQQALKQARHFFDDEYEYRFER